MLLGLLFLGIAPAARASVQVVMTIDGPRGTFATGDVNSPSAMKVTSVQMDLGPSPGGHLVAPKPVTVIRRTDHLSWQFLECLSTGSSLRVVITATKEDDSAPRHRRVVTLSGARVISIHSSLDPTPDDGAAGLGFETIAFTYDRMDVEDDGLRVFTAGM